MQLERTHVDNQVMGNKMNKNADRERKSKGGELRRNDSKKKKGL